MDPAIDCPHHVGLVAVDLDEAAELYRRLGFQVTPPSHHVVSLKEGDPPRPLGTANVIATFPRNYIELVAHVRDDIPNRILAPWLSQFPGFHILALRTRDADAVAEQLDAAGIGHGGVSTLQREVNTEEGTRMLRFRNVAFGGEDLTQRVEWPRGQMPEGGIQAAENLTAEYLFQERYMDHPNGAVDLVNVVLCVADGDLSAFERRYQKYLGRSARGHGDARVFELDQSRITLVPDSALDAVLPGEKAPALPAFVACGVAVRGLAAARSLLEKNGFPVVEAPDSGVFVPSSAALGGAVIFTQAD